MPDLVNRINALDDKDAIYIAQHVLDGFANVLPAFPESRDVALALESFEELPFAKSASEIGEYYALQASAEDGGDLARALLLSLANRPEFESFLSEALEEQDESADFGVLSFGVAFALAWIAIKSEYRISYSKEDGLQVQLSGKGLSSSQQVDIAKKVLPKLAGAFAKVVGRQP